MKGRVIDKIISIIAEASECKYTVCEKTRLEDLDLDSISFVQMIVDIETEFEIEFEMEDLAERNFKVISDIGSRVVELLNNHK